MATNKDILFIDEVIRELDRGWVNGTLCDRFGKCLVGAGMAVSGFRFVYEEDKQGWTAEQISEYLIDVDRSQRRVGARLYDILGYIVAPDEEYLDENEVGPLYPEDKTDYVIEFNDAHHSYEPIRSALVSRLEELRAEQ